MSGYGKRFAFAFFGAMGSMFAGAAVVHRICKPDLVCNAPLQRVMHVYT
jgi:hypothetical protein